MKRHLLMFIALTLSITAMSEIVGIDGINYNLVSGKATVLPVNTSSSGSGETYIGINTGYSGEIFIPSTVTYNGIPYTVTAVEEGVFSSASKLTKVSIPSTVTSLGETPFASCNKLTSIIVDEENPVYCSIGGVLYNKAVTTLIACPGAMTGSFSVPQTVTEIANSAFYGCYQLSAITLPSSVRTIGTKAFRNCTTLTSVNLPSGVTEIKDYMMYGCCSLKTISIPSTVTSIGEYAFYDCHNLFSVEFPSNLTTIGDYAFSLCTKITRINVPEGVIEIGAHAFESCSKLTSVSLSSTVQTVGSGAFRACTLLPRIDVDTANRHLTSDNGVLLDYDKTEVICCPGGWSGAYVVPHTVTEIDENAFYLCQNLSAVQLPNSLTVIRSRAFTSCTKLTEIVIPQNVVLIGKNAFLDCPSLKYVASYTTKVPALGGEIFSSNTYSMPFYTSIKMAASYKAADYWKQFKKICLFGDVNKDGEVTGTDITVLVSSLVENSSYPFELRAGDINNDNTISVVDVVSIVSIILGN